jgi:hypothetical protein
MAAVQLYAGKCSLWTVVAVRNMDNLYVYKLEIRTGFHRLNIRPCSIMSRVGKVTYDVT